MALNLEFVDAGESYEKYRASIHLSGKLGFNLEANSFMNLSGDKYFKIAFEPHGSNFTRMYLVESDASDTTAAKVNKAGQYFYIKLAHVLNRLKVDYKTVSIGFTIEKAPEQYEGRDLYILTKTRFNKRKDNEKKEEGAEEIDTAE